MDFAETCAVLGRPADRGKRPRQQRFDRAGRERRDGRIHPPGARQPRRDHSRGRAGESFIDDDSRGTFHNAHEYAALYPSSGMPVEQYCAPRLQDGYEVEAIRRRIALRAGLVSEEASTSAGELRGFVDRVTPHVIEGWAQNADHPEARVCLDIYISRRKIGQVLANYYRQDLERVGLGSGHHKFPAFLAPAGVALAPATVDVRRSLDGSLLSRSVQAKLPTAA